MLRPSWGISAKSPKPKTMTVSKMIDQFKDNSDFVYSMKSYSAGDKFKKEMVVEQLGDNTMFRLPGYFKQLLDNKRKSFHLTLAKYY